MQVYFCDECGQRIPETSVREGRCHIDEQNSRYVCESCAPKAGVGAARSRKKSGLARRASSGVLAASRARKRDSGSRRVRESRERQSQANGGASKAIALFVAALLLGLAAAYLMGGSPDRTPGRRKNPKTGASSRRSSPVVYASSRAAPPVRLKPQPPKPKPVEPGPPAPPKPQPPARAPKKRELTPFEEHQKLIREGKLPKPKPPKPAATSVNPGTPPAGYAKPANPIIWSDFESGTRQGWEGKGTLVDGGFAPGSLHALRIPSGRGACSVWQNTYTVTDRTTLRMAIWASEDCPGAQIMCWDRTSKDNARVQLSKYLRPGQWVLVKVRLRDFFYWQPKGGPVGHTFGSAGIFPGTGGDLIIDDVAIYEESG